MSRSPNLTLNAAPADKRLSYELRNLLQRRKAQTVVAADLVNDLSFLLYPAEVTAAAVTTALREDICLEHQVRADGVHVAVIRREDGASVFRKKPARCAPDDGYDEDTRPREPMPEEF